MKRFLIFFLCMLITAGCVAGATAETPEGNDGKITISLIGDCSIGDSGQYVTYQNSYHTAVKEHGYDWPFSLVKDILAADDLTVANLEVCLTNRTAHVNKNHYLKADPAHVQILKEGSVEVVNTVNNHCEDYRAQGYQDTLDTLDNAGILRFGCLRPSLENGHDDLLAVDVKGIKIGMIGFSYPQDADLKRIGTRITKLKEEEGCDIVIVSLHWGRETHAQPNSGQMKYAQKVIDMGADAIYGHHAHVTQPIQFYKGKPILYSTGNFTFGAMSRVDPSTGIFQLTYARTDAGVELQKLQVIPCQTQPGPEFRPYICTDPEEITHCFSRLVFSKEYKNCQNPPASFLETGIIELKDGVIQE